MADAVATHSIRIIQMGAIATGGLVVASFAKLIHGVLAVRDLYFYAALFLLCCAGFAFFARKFRRESPSALVPQQQSNDAPAALTNSQNITVQAINDAYNSLDVQLTRETEINLRAALINVPLQEREPLLTRSLVVTLVLYQLEEIWNSIYASQITALETLNTQMLNREDLRPFYNTAAALYPAGYMFYAFEQWIGYLRGQTLIIEQGDAVGITVKGRAFLKMLVDTGRSASAKIM